MINNYNMKDITGCFDSMLGRKKEKASDPRFFELKRGEDGQAAALIRFMPPKIGSSIPFVRLANHFVTIPHGDKNEYISENCPKSIGKPCPICDHYFENTQTNKAYRNKDKYYANILVLKCPNQPEAEGKIFLFRFGRDILNMIDDKINPKKGLEEPQDVFNLKTGLNFKLQATWITPPGFSKAIPNYKESSFGSAGPIVIHDKEVDMEFLEGIDEKLYCLEEFNAPELFKSADELAGILAKKANVLTESATAPSSAPAPAPAPEKPRQPEQSEASKFVQSQDSVGDDFFANL